MQSDSSYALLIVGALVVGAVYCFLGYRTLKLLIALTGFVLAGSAAAVVASMVAPASTIAVLVAGGIGGVCGAFAVLFLFRAGVFLLGVLGAAVIAQSVLGERPEPWVPWALLGISLGGGLLALLLERTILTLATAAIGAWLVVAALSLYFVGPNLIDDPEKWTDVGGGGWIAFIAWVALAIAGAFAQFTFGRRPVPPVAGPPGR